jgi:hypothetical protein
MIGAEELSLINESLMTSLQLEREAKESLQALNRSLEVLVDGFFGMISLTCLPVSLSLSHL